MTTRFGAILVGIDGSVTSYRAGAHAAGMAERRGCELVVVRSFSTITAPTDSTGYLTTAGLLDREKTAEEVRRQLAHRLWKFEATVEVAVTSPLAAIASTADRVGADVVVVGASRKPILRVPGSALSAQLIRLKRWPVLVVP